ncbi:MAG: GTP-sensing pleiotropic transcriptional regulator CodY [Lachnospiraceae bacterium]|nr:GTP-sensing pleiotropic transcriptional regulator CodY [Lachnospiraceae bacterium]
MSVQLLDKTRKINKLLHNNTSKVFVFNDVCKVLSEVLESNVLVISKKGKILGVGEAFVEEGDEDWDNAKVGRFIDEALNERLLNILSTKENVILETLGFEGPQLKRYHVIVTPIDIAGERLGTLFIYKNTVPYDIDDIILAEYGNAVVGLEMLRSLNEESAEEIRKLQIVKSAIGTLSASELEAVHHIFDEMEGKEGILVASKVADRVGITRSVIVNALRKLESAGVIESRSSGMKGTYIKIQNDLIIDELNKLKEDS